MTRKSDPRKVIPTVASPSDSPAQAQAAQAEIRPDVPEMREAQVQAIEHGHPVEPSPITPEAAAAQHERRILLRCFHDLSAAMLKRGSKLNALMEQFAAGGLKRKGFKKRSKDIMAKIDRDLREFEARVLDMRKPIPAKPEPVQVELEPFNPCINTDPLRPQDYTMLETKAHLPINLRNPEYLDKLMRSVDEFYCISSDSEVHDYVFGKFLRFMALHGYWLVPVDNLRGATSPFYNLDHTIAHLEQGKKTE